MDIENLAAPYVDTLRKSYQSKSLARSGCQLELLSALAHGPVTAVSFFGRRSESLDVRLRMEISRLRGNFSLRIATSKDGYIANELCVLLPSTSPVMALMADGQPWPAHSLALVLGKSIRSIERDIQEISNIEAIGSGPKRRYRLTGALPWIATQMLLLSRPNTPLDSGQQGKRRNVL